MFKQAKNLDQAFKSIRLFTIIIIIAFTAVCALVIYKSYGVVMKEQSRVYVLINGKALEAYASDRKDNIPAEARDHVKTFHQLFFTYTPDEKAITANISKALYLADISAKEQYDNLKEQNYFSGIVAGNVYQTIDVDSVQLDLDQYPYHFKCFAIQHLSRSTSKVDRSLITEGFLRNVSRSENNSHGFLIERWKTIENKDQNIQKR